MTKDWCASPSSELVINTAKKYNLSKEDAISIVNTAARNNPALQANEVTFEYLERQPEYKEALKTFVEIPSTKDDNTYDTNATQEEIKQETGLDLSKEEIEKLRNQASEIADQNRASKLSTQEIKDLLDAFKDPRRLSFLGNWINRFTHSMVTEILTNPEYRKKYNISPNATRRDIYLNVSAMKDIRQRLIDNISDAASYWNRQDEAKASELNYAKSHLNTMFFLFGGQTFQEEGIGVNKDGNFFKGESNRPVSEAQNEDDMQKEDGESSTNDFSSSDQNESVYSKIVPEIKSLLADLVEVDEDGYLTDDFYYSFDKFIPVRQSINKLLVICQNCNTYDEMRKKMEGFRKGTPWIGQLLDILDKNTEYSGFESSRYSSSRKEQLQTQFFQSFHKQRTDFLSTYETEECSINTRDVAERSNARKLFASLISRFRRHAGAPVFRDGLLDKKIIEKMRDGLSGGPRVAGSIANRINKAMNMAYDLDEAFAMLSNAEEDMKDWLKDLGLNIPDQMMDDYLSSASDSSGDFNDLLHRGQKLGALRQKMDSLTANMLEMELNENPFERQEKNDRWEIRKDFRSIVDMLTEYSPDAYESMYYSGSKGFYAWNNPSTVQTILRHLNEADRKKAKDYILKKYGQDKEWFMTPDSTSDAPHFYSDWLEDLFYGKNGISIEYKEKPVAFTKSYSELSDREYALSMLNDFFQRQNGENKYSLYRMLISSDKPRYALLKAPRREQKYIAEKAADFFAQELNRAIGVVRFAAKDNGEAKIDNYDIKLDSDEKKAVFEKIKAGNKISIDDVLKDGRYIFRNTGASFFLNKFLNREIEEKTELGQYVVERMFNSESHAREKLVTPAALSQFKDAFRGYITDMSLENVLSLKRLGALEKVYYNKTYHSKTILPLLKNWHSKTDEEWNDFAANMYFQKEKAAQYAQWLDGVELDKENTPYYCEIAQFSEDLVDYCANNWLAKANMMEVFDVDPAFYGNTTNYQKREAQIISAGFTADPTARLHGDLVTDGKYRSITIKTKKKISDTISNIETYLRAQMDTIRDPKRKEEFRKGMEDTLDKLGKMDVTDGQAFTGLSALRKRLVGLGEWSRSDSKALDEKGFIDDASGRHYIFTDEAVYQRMKRGYKTKEDQDAKTYDLMHVFAQPQKPFMFGFSNINRSDRGTLTTPVQHKNSEYMLSFLVPYVVQEKDKGRPADKKKLSQIEALSIFLEESFRNDPLHGIDTVNWDTAVKIGGNSKSIDLSDLDGYQTIQALQDATSKNDDAVTEYDVEDYKIIASKPEHFKDHSQPLGTQMKVLSVANTADDAQITLSYGETISGRELKERYLKAMEEKTKRSETDFYHDVGLDLPREQRMHRLSNTLKRLMATDQKFDAEMRHALGVTEKDGELQFNIPLDEPGIQSAIEAMIYSQIRKVYYRQNTNGGIVVQASPWGQSDKYHIRFFSSNPQDKDGLIPVKSTWLKNNPGKTDSDYEAYTKTYQKGYAWFECKVPMPKYVRDMLSDSNGKVKDKYFNSDGSWNMKAIREDVPATVFDAICYRIPTESKYSMMVCKVKDFCREDGGDICMYPEELTTFTGSDFDIDTDFIELRPKAGEKNRDVDSEIFELQMASLRNGGSAYETFHSGDFSDLSELSYKVRLLEEGIDPNSVSDLKKACAAVEDMDLMNPITDMLLRRQNMEAKQLIGMAAVGVTSHAFFSLYNADDNPSNKVMLNIRKGIRNHDTEIESESFIVIGKSIPGKKEQYKSFTGYNVLDGIYDMDGKLISLEIGKYVGASADAAKDAALYRLGINKTTMPVLMTLHRLGVSSDVARLFVAQPIIKVMSERLTNGDVKSVSDVCDQMAKEIETDGIAEGQLQEGAWDEVRFGVKKLNYNDLIRNIADPQSESAGDMLNLLGAFKAFHSLSRSIKNLDSFVRYNASRAMDGSSVLSRYAKRRKLDMLADVLDADNPRIALPKNVEGEGYHKLENMFPYISMAIDGEEELADGLLLDNMGTYSDTFFSIADRLLGNQVTNEEEDARVLNTLYSAWKTWLLFNGSSSIANFSDKDTVKKYTTNFPDYYYGVIDNLSQEKNPEFYKKVIKDNSFLNSIGYVPSITGQYLLLSTDVNGISGEDIDRYKNDWAALLNYPETRQLAIDLGIYFLARSSSYNASTPIHIMPISVKEAVDGYLDTFTKAKDLNLSRSEADIFLEKFQRNNSRDGKIVPQFWNIDEKIFDVREEDGELRFYYAGNRDIERQITRWCTDIGYGDEHAYIFNMPVISVDGVMYKVKPAEQLTEGEAYATYFPLEKMVTPLGVEREFPEYTGLDDSIFTVSANNISFTESNGDYPQRTRENAQWSDITLALAVDFKTRGEQLTREAAGKKYVNSVFDANGSKITSSPEKVADSILSQIKKNGLPQKDIKLNIAGNGIYSLNVSQEEVDTFVNKVLFELIRNGITISEVRSGGQTGIDEAGVKAAAKLGIKASVHAPKGYMFRGKDGKDISDMQSFVERFQEPSNPESSAVEPPQIDDNDAVAIAENVINELSTNALGEIEGIISSDGFKFSKESLKGLIANWAKQNTKEIKQNFINAGMSIQTAEELFGKIEGILSKQNTC